ncbi:MAG TPA: RNA-binding S4 domain-containing protein [Bacilli bacterium]|jgi:ribosome-associated protein|nr:RNA-binding S4 domain-containing protein [Bacilli bacterium]HPK86284.1 RNA-binding S4 domain-containing protein [Bacilli bacterium]
MKKEDTKTTDFTLGQFLKKHNFVASGGAAKLFLLENDVLVNGELERRRGRKLKEGDVVSVDGKKVSVKLDHHKCTTP